MAKDVPDAIILSGPDFYEVVHSDSAWCLHQSDCREPTVAICVDVPGTSAAGTEADQIYPNLRGLVSWAVNMTGLGADYQFDHLVFLEPLHLPAEAADPKITYGGYMHILMPY
eukprot:s2443_g1.t1